MTNLARHHNNFPNITININIEPADLIVYADEKLITQVVLNAASAFFGREERHKNMFRFFRWNGRTIVAHLDNHGLVRITSTKTPTAKYVTDWK